MNERILYLDCDGVILDTIECGFRMMKEQGLDYTSWDIAHEFFVNTDWYTLVYEAGIIRRDGIKSTMAIRKLLAENLFADIKILTKLSGNEEEETVKRKLFGRLFPDIEVITLKFDEHKDTIVNPINNILVDDDERNINRWRNANGIGVWFVANNPQYEIDQISNLGQLKESSSIRKLIKTRIF